MAEEASLRDVGRGGSKRSDLGFRAGTGAPAPPPPVSRGRDSSNASSQRGPSSTPPVPRVKGGRHSPPRKRSPLRTRDEGASSRLPSERARPGERAPPLNAPSTASEPSKSEDELLRRKEDVSARLAASEEKRRGFEARVAALEAAINLQSARNAKLSEDNHLLEEKILRLQQAASEPSIDRSELLATSGKNGADQPGLETMENVTLGPQSPLDSSSATLEPLRSGSPVWPSFAQGYQPALSSNTPPVSEMPQPQQFPRAQAPDTLAPSRMLPEAVIAAAQAALNGDFNTAHSVMHEGMDLPPPPATPPPVVADRPPVVCAGYSHNGTGLSRILA